MVFITYSKGVVSMSIVSTLPGNVSEMQILGLYLDLLNQKLCGWSPVVCVLTNSLGDSHAC